MRLQIAFAVVLVGVVIAVEVAVAALDEGYAELVAAAPLAGQAHRVVHAAEGIHVEALAELEVELAVATAARRVERVLDGVAAGHGLLAQGDAHLAGQALVAVPGLSSGGGRGSGRGGGPLGDDDGHQQRGHREGRGVRLGRRRRRGRNRGGGVVGQGGGYHSRSGRRGGRRRCGTWRPCRAGGGRCTRRHRGGFGGAERHDGVLDEDGGGGGRAGCGLALARLHLEGRAGRGQPQEARLGTVQGAAAASVQRARPAAQTHHGARAAATANVSRRTSPVALAPGRPRRPPGHRGVGSGGGRGRRRRACLLAVLVGGDGCADEADGLHVDGKVTEPGAARAPPQPSEEGKARALHQVGHVRRVTQDNVAVHVDSVEDVLTRPQRSDRRVAVVRRERARLEQRVQL